MEIIDTSLDRHKQCVFQFFLILKQFRNWGIIDGFWFLEMRVQYHGFRMSKCLLVIHRHGIF